MILILILNNFITSFFNYFKESSLMSFEATTINFLANSYFPIFSPNSKNIFLASL